MRRNLENQIFGRLKVIRQTSNHITTGGNIQSRWICSCSCGKETTVLTSSLLGGKTKSCGCLLRDNAIELGYKNKQHGDFSKFASLSDLVKRQALLNIKERSKRCGYSSDLEIEDIPELTERCPVLGIRYEKGTLKKKDASPSIDRKNPNLPYLKKYAYNLIFISHRANRIKSNANVDELKKIIDYMGSLSLERESSLINSNSIDLLTDNEAEPSLRTVID
jgi:hypothetical protein